MQYSYFWSNIYRAIVLCSGCSWLSTSLAPPPICKNLCCLMKAYVAPKSWSSTLKWTYLTSAEDVENYFNTRQLQHHERLNIKDQTFSLCHLDIAPRNVLRLSNGS